jgi:hypothetical protein
LVSSCTLTFSNTYKPIVYNFTENQVISIQRNLQYTVQTAALDIRAINSPESYSVSGLPQNLSTYNNLVIGSVDSAINAGDYQLTVTATNTYGVSVPVHVKLRVPIAAVAPTYTANIAINTTYADIYTTEFTPLLEEAVAITWSVLPLGLAFNQTQSGSYTLSGTPTRLGAYTITITGTTQQYGTAQITLTVNVAAKLFTVSGRIVNSAVPPIGVAGVAMQVAGNSSSATTTNAQGYYTLTGFAPGAYNVYPITSTYSILPAYRTISITAVDRQRPTLEIAEKFSSELNTPV